MVDEPEIITTARGRNMAGTLRGWPGAYVAFLRSPHESRILKLMPLALIGVVPLSIVDDFLLPVVGIADDIPTWIVTLIVVGMTAWKVKRYRCQP